MEIKRRQTVIIFSVVYLAGLTILAAYAFHTAHVYNLPIPDIVSAFAVALPPLAGIALEAVMSFNTKLARKGQIQTSRVFQLTVAFFLVLETMLATLAGIHIAPQESRMCSLRKRWENLYRAKEGKALRRIQDSYDCCGFKSPLDMAYPFKDANNNYDACKVNYGRDRACFEPWRYEEKKVAILLLVVPLAVFVWKVAIIMAPSSQSSWMPSHIRLPSDDDSNSADAEAGRQRARRVIGYRDLEEPGEEDSLRREVTNLNKDSQLASHVEGNRVRSSNRLLNEANEWREARNTRE